MDFQSMTDSELLSLIADATRALQARATGAAQQPDQTAPTPGQRDPQMAALLDAPEKEDADFVLMIAARIRGGGYVKAHERERIAAIAQDYPVWVRRQGLPTVHNAGEWRRTTANAGAPRARAR